MDSGGPCTVENNQAHHWVHDYTHSVATPPRHIRGWFSWASPCWRCDPDWKGHDQLISQSLSWQGHRTNCVTREVVLMAFSKVELRLILRWNNWKLEKNVWSYSLISFTIFQVSWHFSKHWGAPRRVLGVSQTRAGRVPDEWGEEPAQNINCWFFFSSFFLSVCVTEFSEVLPPFFPPPIFSSVRVGVLVVVVGGCGGTDNGT